MTFLSLSLSLCAQTINGHGIDRHLLGMRLIAQENGLPVPEIFTDPAYKKSTHYNLSTSQVGLNSAVLSQVGVDSTVLSQVGLDSNVLSQVGQIVLS